ncbi:MAG: ABC transporter ATP-binding protein [Pseudomonadota bacterium]
MIELNRVSKSYKTTTDSKIILRNQTLRFQPGTSYALLGVNGAGKSTTMRLLSGAELPNSGSIKRNVRVSWPLGFANGFHMMMSGKDNLKFVARAYGEDHRKVLHFVAEFAEIGDYMNQPIHTYSSGMMARFAFGLSMAVEFDCYLVDEITSVGDARFQERCRAAFASRREQSDVIMISHDMGTIKQYCQKGLVLVDGQLLQFDEVDDAISTYFRLNR